MKCPFCGKEMVRGHVQSARKVFFTENRQRFYFIPGADDFVLTQHNFTGPICMAYHCTGCKKVIIDYSKEE